VGQPDQAAAGEEFEGLAAAAQRPASTGRS
jgi:hypothetical protein